jgi:hypothetical protein
MDVKKLTAGTLVNDISQLKGPVKMQIDWMKLTAKRSGNNALMPFPHPPLVPGVKYAVQNVAGKAVVTYPKPCSWGGSEVNGVCHLKTLDVTPLPVDVPYIGAGVYYVTEPILNKGCPYGGRQLDLHDYYGSWWWIPSCQVMELDRGKIDPLRSVEILMHSDPSKRIIRYLNDY